MADSVEGLSLSQREHEEQSKAIHTMLTRKQRDKRPARKYNLSKAH